MSVAVSIEALRDKIAEFGPTAYLVTVGGKGQAHVVSVRADVVDDGIRVSAGRTSRANTVENPTVTLLWPAPPGQPYSLIADGSADATDEAESSLLVRPVRAVLHRVAGAPDELPNCVTVEE